ncbi:hypothetical protein PR202_gb28399 [Eleusine coracana subsp. coracana]|uniref:DUF659 domain-containing protein n=1 Tax=Eleusine coracana subsp. coracana TaxID=191504 RepID=A0AAV5FX81_ELECO|nr:hypothetical protein PR202_gb28399 [Eleusine coracana subsp. coracana]
MDVSSSSQVHESEMEAKVNLDSLLGRLIFEAGLGPDFLHLPSFQGMIDLLTRGVRIAMPTYEHILQVQLREVEQRERALKKLWERNGCSLILDRWNSHGKSFISAFVHHNEGMLFLRSMDISTITNDIDELASVVCEVVDDISARNIVQIIINDSSSYMQAVEHAVLKKYDHSLLFTLCADYCINLILENIAALDHVNEVLMKARRITRFIYSHALPMQLKEHYILGGEIISNCHLKYVAMFVTLERLVSQRANLLEMFSSSEWTSSDLASTNLSRQVCEIIQSENAFWRAAASILKVTAPIINVLLKLETDNCSMGVLYDAMDSAKEEIKRNLGREHGRYWKLIDRIWDHYLHSHIHAAGYFLNPKIFYSESSNCILCFITGIAVPWWLKHGGGTRELQSFACRILSQTCFGASRYNIDKSLSERLHTEARSYPDQETFRKEEYIYYNLRLRNSVPRLHGPCEGKHGKLGPKLGDWISAENTPVGQHF